MEQYKLLLDQYDNEMNRYWTRFNVGLGFQIALLLVFINGLSVLSANPHLFRLLLFLANVFSWGFLVVVFRGLNVQSALLHAIRSLEEESKGELKLLTLVEKGTRLPLVVNQIVATIQALVLSLFWIVVYVILESSGYSVVIPR
jgi:hypothetical protein